MTEATREREAPGRLEAAAGAFAGAAFAGGALLLREASPVPAGVFDGAAAVMLGWGLSVAAHRAWSPAAATLVRGLALAAGALLLAAALATPYDRAALPLAAWALGGAFLQASTRTRGWRLPLAAAGLALLAAGVAVAWTAASAWPEAGRLRAAVVIAAALAAAGLAARAAILRRWPRLAPSPVGALLLGALTASYLAYRPLVAQHVANLPLYEWSLGVGAAALMLGRLRAGARDASVDEAWSGEARRHRHDAAPAYDPRQTLLAAPIQRYLDTGDGFDEYRAAMMRAAPFAPPSFRKTLQGARPVQGRGGRAGKAARRERLATHDAWMELLG